MVRYLVCLGHFSFVLLRFCFTLLYFICIVFAVWPFGDPWCKSVQFLIIVTALVSIYTLVLMSVDRWNILLQNAEFSFDLHLSPSTLLSSCPQTGKTFYNKTRNFPLISVSPSTPSSLCPSTGGNFHCMYSTTRNFPLIRTRLHLHTCPHVR